MKTTSYTNKFIYVQASAEYFALVRQHMLAELEPDFSPACLAVGLAERQQQYKPERLDSINLKLQ